MNAINALFAELDVKTDSFLIQLKKLRSQQVSAEAPLHELLSELKTTRRDCAKEKRRVCCARRRAFGMYLWLRIVQAFLLLRIIAILCILAVLYICCFIHFCILLCANAAFALIKWSARLVANLFMAAMRIALWVFRGLCAACFYPFRLVWRIVERIKSYKG